jgi:hypothetical protein
VHRWKLKQTGLEFVPGDRKLSDLWHKPVAFFFAFDGFKNFLGILLTAGLLGLGGALLVQHAKDAHEPAAVRGHQARSTTATKRVIVIHRQACAGGASSSGYGVLQKVSKSANRRRRNHERD